jgi:hypothetical protein
MADLHHNPEFKEAFSQFDEGLHLNPQSRTHKTLNLLNPSRLQVPLSIISNNGGRFVDDGGSV